MLRPTHLLLLLVLLFVGTLADGVDKYQDTPLQPPSLQQQHQNHQINNNNNHNEKHHIVDHRLETADGDLLKQESVVDLERGVFLPPPGGVGVKPHQGPTFIPPHQQQHPQNQIHLQQQHQGANNIILPGQGQGPAPVFAGSEGQPIYQQGPGVGIPSNNPITYQVEANQVEYGTDLAQGGQSYGPPQESWPVAAAEEMPKISHMDVKCEKNLMKVAIEFDRPFNGVIFSKGHYSYGNCVHLPAGTGRSSVYFDIGINSCGTTGNTQNGLYGYGGQSGSGTFFENTVIIQYDPQVQEIWDQARKLRCTWHDQYEKAVTFRPFPVDMLDVVRADFAGDNVGCWMQIQVGKGPWASEVAGIVKIGQTMTMVLAIKDEDNKFDMLVRNCIAHDGKRAPIELVDSNGCITRPKLMSRFTKIKNFGSSATVLSYAHFQAFKFPDSMEVHFQCTIQICRYNCPEQCSANQPLDPYAGGVTYAGSSSDKNEIAAPKTRHERDLSAVLEAATRNAYDVTQLLAGGSQKTKEIGVQKIIQVVSSGDLAFSMEHAANDSTMLPTSHVTRMETADRICMSALGFTGLLFFLVAILISSCLVSVFFFLKHRSASLKASAKKMKAEQDTRQHHSMSTLRSTTSSVGGHSSLVPQYMTPFDMRSMSRSKHPQHPSGFPLKH